MLGAGVLVVPWSAMADAGLAREDHVAIFGGNIDPWRGGRAMIEERTFEARTPEFAINVDPELSPLPALAEALGVPFDPPRIGYAKLSGQVYGHAGFTFGYSFGAGELSIVYPLTARIAVDSSADNNVFAAGYPITITTGFAPGLPRPLSGPVCSAGDFGACSVTDSARKMLASVHLPDFRTTFADARAYAEFDYDVGAGLAATVGIAKVGQYCFSCFSRRFSIRDAEVVPLIDVSPAGVMVAGLGRKDLFPATFETPYGRIFADLPQPRVRRERFHGASMSGEEEPTIISFEAAVEKLVPVVGPLLSNNVGPLGYTLLETQGGPSLSLRQSFHFTITPMVTLRFSHPVDVNRSGVRQVSEIAFPLGESVRIVAGEAAVGAFTITPIYWLDARVKNSTRLALGLSVSARMMKLSLAGVNAGPFGEERFQVPEIAGAELCCAEFRLSLPRATTAPLSFMLSGQLSGYATEKIKEGNYDGLRQPMSEQDQPSRPPQDNANRYEEGLRPDAARRELTPPQRGRERLDDQRAWPAPTFDPPPPPPPPPPAGGMIDDQTKRSDRPQLVRKLPEGDGVFYGRGQHNSHPTAPSVWRVAGGPSRARTDQVVSEIHQGRLRGADIEKSPAVQDGEMTVYIAGIPREGMSVIQQKPKTLIRPRDMQPRVIHKDRTMGQLLDVSTTNRDPRMKHQPDDNND